jgi:hypothetical protein
MKARLESYEKGELERSVALQNIAKRLKEENERLMSENTLLKQKLAECEARISSLSTQEHLRGRKRRRDTSPSILSSSPSDSSCLVDRSVPQESVMDSLDVKLVPSLPVHELLASKTSDHIYDQLDALNKDANLPPADNLTSCGFCTDESSCVCRAIAMEPVGSLPRFNELLESFERPLLDMISSTEQTVLPSKAPPPSILENLPPYQPPLLLRRRRQPGVPVKSIFPVTPLQDEIQKVREKECSGDPNNCEACRDDTFGKAFCEAVVVSVAANATSLSNCGDCSSTPNDHYSHSPRARSESPACCGQPQSCSHFCSTTRDEMDVDMTPTDASEPVRSIPTNQAWQQFKAHPNVEFADLTLLADVVARRSKCEGPQVVISPPLGAATPDRVASPSMDWFNSDAQSPSVSIECGHEHRVVRKVPYDAVQDCLRMLDGKSPRP